MLGVKDDEMFQALSPDGADQAFDVRILPGALRSISSDFSAPSDPSQRVRPGPDNGERQVYVSGGGSEELLLQVEYLAAVAPWYVALSDDKKKLRLNVLSHILSLIPYQKLKRDKVKLPERQKAGGYRSPKYPFKYVPEVKL